jgi:hypothetical protein
MSRESDSFGDRYVSTYADYHPNIVKADSERQPISQRRFNSIIKSVEDGDYSEKYMGSKALDKIRNEISGWVYTNAGRKLNGGELKNALSAHRVPENIFVDAQEAPFDEEAFRAEVAKETIKGPRYELLLDQMSLISREAPVSVLSSIIEQMHAAGHAFWLSIFARAINGQDLPYDAKAAFYVAKQDKDVGDKIRIHPEYPTGIPSSTLGAAARVAGYPFEVRIPKEVGKAFQLVVGSKGHIKQAMSDMLSGKTNTPAVFYIEALGFSAIPDAIRSSAKDLLEFEHGVYGVNFTKSYMGKVQAAQRAQTLSKNHGANLKSFFDGDGNYIRQIFGPASKSILRPPSGGSCQSYSQAEETDRFGISARPGSLHGHTTLKDIKSRTKAGASTSSIVRQKCVNTNIRAIHPGNKTHKDDIVKTRESGSDYSKAQLENGFFDSRFLETNGETRSKNRVFLSRPASERIWSGAEGRRLGASFTPSGRSTATPGGSEFDLLDMNDFKSSNATPQSRPGGRRMPW